MSIQITTASLTRFMIITGSFIGMGLIVLSFLSPVNAQDQSFMDNNVLYPSQNIPLMQQNCNARLAGQGSPPYNRTQINNAAQYDHLRWISLYGFPTNDNISVGPGVTANLQMNYYNLICSILVEGSNGGFSNSELDPTESDYLKESPPQGSANPLHYAALWATQYLVEEVTAPGTVMIDTNDDGTPDTAVPIGTATLSEPGHIVTVARDPASRHWFGNRVSDFSFTSNPDLPPGDYSAQFSFTTRARQTFHAPPGAPGSDSNCSSTFSNCPVQTQTVTATVTVREPAPVCEVNISPESVVAGSEFDINVVLRNQGISSTPAGQYLLTPIEDTNNSNIQPNTFPEPIDSIAPGAELPYQFTGTGNVDHIGENSMIWAILDSTNGNRVTSECETTFTVSDTSLRIQGQKVVGEGSNIIVPSANEAPGNFELEMTRGTTESTNPTPGQPYTFSSIKPSSSTGDFQIVVEEDDRFELIGWTICANPDGSPRVYEGTESPCSHANLTLRPMGPGNSVTLPDLGVPDDSDHYVDIWFHYEELVRYVQYRKVDLDCNLVSTSSEPAGDRVRRYNTYSQYSNESNDSSGSPPHEVTSSTQRQHTFDLIESPDYLRVYPDNANWTYEGFSRDTCNSPTSSSNGLSVSWNSTSPDTQVVFFYYQERIDTPLPEKKVYGAQDVQISPNAVRDNRQITMDVNAFWWADATHRFNGANTSINPATNRHLWTAGAYGIRVSDPSSQSVVNDRNLNTATQYNTKAEEGCPNSSSCLHRVPLAYVSANDDSGRPATNPDGSAGATTPQGNNWLKIRSEGFGTQSDGTVTSCGTYNDAYRSVCGGRASDLSNNIGGATGNFLRNVEISNIHIRTNGLQVALTDTGLQGKVPTNTIQVTDIQDKSLAAGSGFLPPNSQGPTPNTPIWDNIRNPNSPNTPLTVTSVSTNKVYDNTEQGGSSYGAFLILPNAMTTTYDQRDTPIARVQSASLLQDGNGVYTNGTEPLTYTAMVDRANDVRLMWDEYIEWTQVDDKGHWHTTRSTQPTGVATWHGYEDEYYLQGFDKGTEEDYEVEECETVEDEDGEEVEECEDVTYQTTCDGSTPYRTGVAYSSNSKAYYHGSNQTRFGWLINTHMGSGTLTGTNMTSYFASNPANNPSWSNTSEPYWQDITKTSMDNSGSSDAITHSKRWVYNTTDRAYSNRYIFDQTSKPSFYTGWYYTYSYSCSYPNAPGAYDSGGGTTSTYYPFAYYLYESSTSPTGNIYGRYNFADDGVKDNVLDTGWAWKSNLQRVRYEHTWENHYRKLGPRYSWRLGGRPGYTTGLSNQRSLIYGLNPLLQNSSNPLDEDNKSASILASRGRATIWNPLIAAGNADIYAGGGLDSYFENSVASSAFVFTQNGGVSNVSHERLFNNYFINPDQDVAARLDEGHLDRLFTNLTQLETQAQANSITSDPLNPSTLGNAHNRLYHHSGDLTLSAGNFGRGAKTIIVTGNLYINGNIGYAGVSLSNRSQLPSVGFIVMGDVIVADNVTNIVGAYAVNRCFNIESKLSSANLGCTSYVSTASTTIDSEPNFRLDGLAIADRFALLRQPSGNNLAHNQYAETFNYDGRVIINNPPGFSRIFTEPQDWLEVTPRN